MSYLSELIARRNREKMGAIPIGEERTYTKDWREAMGESWDSAIEKVGLGEYSMLRGGVGLVEGVLAGPNNQQIGKPNADMGRLALGAYQTTSGLLDATVGTAFSGLITAGWEGEEIGARRSKFLGEEKEGFLASTINTLNRGGEELSKFIIGNQYDEIDKEAFKDLGSSAAIDLVTLGVGKAIGSGLRGLKKARIESLAKKADEAIEGSRTATDTFSILNKESDLYKRVDGVRATLDDIVSGKKNISKAEFENIIKDTPITKKDLTDILTPNKAVHTSSIASDAIIEAGEKLVKNTEYKITSYIEKNKVDINIPENFEKMKIDLGATGVKPKEIETFKAKTEAIKYLNEDLGFKPSSVTEKINEYIEIKNLSPTEKVSATVQNIRKTLLDDLEKEGIVKVTKNNNGIAQVKFTPKGIKEIPDDLLIKEAKARGINTIDAKKDLIAKAEEFEIKDLIEEGSKNITKEEAKVFKEILEDKVIGSRIEEQIISRSINSNSNSVQLINHLNYMNNKYSFFNKRIDNSNIDEAFNAFKKSSDDGHITYGRVAGEFKRANNKVFNQIKKALFNISEKSKLLKNDGKYHSKKQALDNTIKKSADKIKKSIDEMRMKMEEVNNSIKELRAREKAITRKKLNKAGFKKLKDLEIQKIKYENRLFKNEKIYKDKISSYREKLTDLKAEYGAKIGRSAFIESSVKTLAKEIKENSKVNINTDKIITKRLSGSQIDKLKQKELNGIINQIEEDITKEYAKKLEAKILKELSPKKSGKIGKLNSRTIDIDTLTLLNRYRDLLRSKGFDNYNLDELEIISKEVENIKSAGRRQRIINEKNRSLGMIRILEGVEKKGLKEVGGFKDKSAEGVKRGVIKNMLGSWSSLTQYAEKRLNTIFNGDKELMNAFIHNTREAIDNYEIHKDFIKKTYINTIAKELHKNKINPNHIGEFLIARRLNEYKGKKLLTGLERLQYDNTSLLNIPTDKYIGTPKPEYLNHITDEWWEKITKSELAGVMLKYGKNTHFKNIVDKIDGLYEDLGAQLSEVAKRADNADIGKEPFYTPFSYKKGRSVEFDASAIDVPRRYVTSARAKPVAEDFGRIQKGDIEMDKNILSLLHGPTDESLRYIHLRAQSKHMNDLYNGPTKYIGGATVKELQENSDKLYIGGHRIEMTGEIGPNGGSMVKYAKLDEDGNIIKNIDGEIEWHPPVEKKTSSIKIGSKVRGLGELLGPNSSFYLRKFMEKFANGGSIPPTTELGVAINKLGSHFNAVPLIYNLGVILKQPGVLIDSMGNNGIYRTSRYTYLGDLIDAIDEVPGVKQRIGAKGNFMVKQMQDFDNLKTSTLINAYSSWRDLGMTLIGGVDQVGYKRVWAATADRIFNEMGILSGERLTKDVLNKNRHLFTKITVEADKIASTGSGQFKPRVYDDVYSKQLFGIFSTQLTRIENIITTWEKEGKIILGKGASRAERVKAINNLVRGNTMFLVTNAYEVAITYWTAKLLGGLGFDKKKEDKAFFDEMTSLETFNRITWQQFFTTSKINSYSTFESLTPMGGQIHNIFKEVSKIAKEAVVNEKANFEQIEKSISKITSSSTGKGTEYIINFANHLFGRDEMKY